MDSDLVSDSLSSNEGSGGVGAAAPLKTYTDIFNELFPFYLSIGMTYEQYWEKDSTLVKAYRKAYEIRMDRRNQEMWLQGDYIYEAFLRVSPVLHAFAKKNVKPIPYMSEPLSLSKAQSDARERKREKAVYDKGKSRMDDFARSFNQKFKKGSE